jgi:hypothetical protein
MKSGVSSDWMDEEWYEDIRGSKVDPWMSIWLCTDRIPDLWGLVNWCSLMIVVVRQYPTIPLEMSTRIVYGPPMDSSVCGITWKTCNRERWDPYRPYDIVVKSCHTWPIHRRAYVVLVRFIPLQGWLLIRISVTLPDMSDSLFIAPTHRNACLLLWWWLRWLIIDDEHDYYDDVFTLQYCLLSCMF